MKPPSKKYLLILVAIAICLIAVAVVGLFLPLRDGPNLWVFSYFPFVGTAALLLTLPVSLVWLVVAARKKKWDSVRHLAFALAVPVVAFGSAIAATWRIMRELFPA